MGISLLSCLVFSVIIKIKDESYVYQIIHFNINLRNNEIAIPLGSRRIPTGSEWTKSTKNYHPHLTSPSSKEGEEGRGRISWFL